MLFPVRSSHDQCSMKPKVGWYNPLTNGQRRRPVQERFHDARVGPPTKLLFFEDAKSARFCIVKDS